MGAAHPDPSPNGVGDLAADAGNLPPDSRQHFDVWSFAKADDMADGGRGAKLAQPEGEDGKTRTKVAKAVGMGRLSYAKAKAVVAAAEGRRRSYRPRGPPGGP